MTPLDAWYEREYMRYMIECEKDAEREEEEEQTHNVKAALRRRRK